MRFIAVPLATALAALLPTTLVAQASAPAMPAASAVDPAVTFLAHNRTQAGVTQTASGVQYKVIEPGSGAAHPGDADVVLITYKGTLTDGTTFDESAQPTPMEVSGVVPGFAEALKLMPKGAKYRFWLPPALAYGDRPTGPIPAHSVLVFDIQLLDWKSEAEIQAMQQQQAPQTTTAPPLSAEAVTTFLTHNRTQPGVMQTASGLQYKLVTPGAGAARPTDADVTLVTYKGTLIDGSTFDESAQPVPMPVAEVVPGFSEALKLMTKGATYRVWIKPELGYGETATGPIPGHSVLIFDIHLLDWRSMEELRRAQAQPAPAATPTPATPAPSPAGH